MNNDQPLDLAEYILIPRSKIPAARMEGGYVLAGDYEAALCDDLSVDLAWRQARECISVAMFLETLAAARARDKRRDEICAELFDADCYDSENRPTYISATPVVKRAISRIIELESK